MGLFSGSSVFRCPAGQWTEVVSTSFAQMPATFRLAFRVPPGAMVQGQAEVTASTWIFPGTPSLQPLQNVMQFERGIWNTFFKVRVCPMMDVEVEVT